MSYTYQELNIACLEVVFGKKNKIPQSLCPGGFL